jgi:hypothetical protein
MTHFSISYHSEFDRIDIAKNLKDGYDNLDIMMLAVGDALSAAGYDDDHRLIQLKDFWADLNKHPSVDDDEWLDAYIAPDTVKEEQVAQEWPPLEFLKGDIVRVSRGDVADDGAVLNKVGTVSYVYPHDKVQPVYVRFAEGDIRAWHCAPADLNLIYRP